MSDLLRIGASGIGAYRSALSVIADNVANAETPGYARRDVALRETSAASAGPLYRAPASGGGVAAASVTRAWDAFKSTDARDAASDAAGAGTRAQWLGAVEKALPDGDNGIPARIGSFFSAAGRLAGDPTSGVARSAALAALGDAAASIRSGAAGLARVREGIGADATATVASANSNLTALAEVNRSIARAPEGSNAKAALSDQRDRLLGDLSSQIGIDATIAANGTVAVSIAGAPETALVSGDAASAIGLTLGEDGRLSLDIGGARIAPSGGKLAGLRDAAATAADSTATLDKLAVEFAGQINSWQAQGRNPAGATGTPLLTVGATAATLVLATSDPSAIAAASDGGPGGNMATLTDLRGPMGAEARISALINLNAQALATTNAQASAANSRRDAAAAARDDVSGVDLDREAAELIRYQQAYDGAAKVIQVARETLNSILQLF
jgi:flagellar hook-associated protein 1 FlgK